jgi:2'-5' RNA ligase
MVDEVLRTFIAVELDEVLLHDLAALQNRFKKQTPMGSVKWVAPAGMHLTLKFLGDTPSERVPEIIAALQRACAGFSPFDLTLEGRGCFPSFHKPRVIWVSVRTGPLCRDSSERSRSTLRRSDGRRRREGSHRTLRWGAYRAMLIKIRSPQSVGPSRALLLRKSGRSTSIGSI